MRERLKEKKKKSKAVSQAYITVRRGKREINIIEGETFTTGFSKNLKLKRRLSGRGGRRGEKEGRRVGEGSGSKGAVIGKAGEGTSGGAGGVRGARGERGYGRWGAGGGGVRRGRMLKERGLGWDVDGGGRGGGGG